MRCMPQTLFLLSCLKFWSLDGQLQNKQCFDSVAAIVSDHIRHHAFEMPSLQQCVQALSDLRTRASQPLAVVGGRALAVRHNITA